MRTLYRSLLLISVLSLFATCKKKENDIPVLVVVPEARDIDVVSGQVVTFIMEGRSDNSTLTRLIITSKRGNGFTTTVIDSTLSGDRFYWNWEFQVPHAPEDYYDLYTFTLYDANGETMSTSRTLYVTLGETLLSETSGHLFYSKNSTIHPESAFDIEDRVQVIYTADSTRRDIQDNQTNGTATELSRSWITPANGRMLRYNGFDYANATNISLRNAFDTGIPLEQIDNIQVGDVIITRLGSLPANTSHYAALLVTGIVDETGTADEDRYIFNMKWTVFME